jgi:hypothetical protein
MPGIQRTGQETSFAEMLNVISAAGAHPVIAIESCGSETLSGSLCTGREAILDHCSTTQSFLSSGEVLHNAAPMHPGGFYNPQLNSL